MYNIKQIHQGHLELAVFSLQWHMGRKLKELNYTCIHLLGIDSECGL